jgi:hypothetical protein
MLGLRAFAVATALVGAFGCAVVLTTRGALGITTFREFGNVMRGRPKYEIPVLDEADDNWLDALEVFLLAGKVCVLCHNKWLRCNGRRSTPSTQF